MAINFPTSPALNDEYTFGTRTWVWNGTSWYLKQNQPTVLLDMIKTVDGAGSGLDSDLVDGTHASAFYLATNPSGYITSSSSITGNAATATILQTSRTINGVNFNGSTNITVADSTKLPLSGGTMTGAISFAVGQTWPTFNQNTTGSASTFTSTSQNSQFNSIGVGTAGSTTAGEIRATNNITAYYSSDIKFKTNIREIEGALDIVKMVGGKLFDWNDQYIKDHGGEDGYFIRKSDFGLIAQDLEKSFPLGVRKRPDGSLAVDYEKLCVISFAAINEQSDLISEQAQQIKRLEEIITKLAEKCSVQINL